MTTLRDELEKENRLFKIYLFEKELRSLAELVLDYQSSITPKLESEEAVLVYIEKEKANIYNKELLDNFETEVKKYFESQKTKVTDGISKEKI